MRSMQSLVCGSRLNRTSRRTAMARKTANPAKSTDQQGLKRRNEVLDVTVVLLEEGYASTAIAPIEIFHSAGLLWNWLHGHAIQPRFRVRTASVDGRSLRTVCALGLTPDCAISDIKRNDIIVVQASCWDVIC